MTQLANAPDVLPMMQVAIPTLVDQWIKPVVDASIAALVLLIGAWAHIIAAKINGGQESQATEDAINKAIDYAKAHGVTDADALIDKASIYAQNAFPDAVARIEKGGVDLRDRIIRQLGQAPTGGK